MESIGCAQVTKVTYKVFRIFYYNNHHSGEIGVSMGAMDQITQLIAEHEGFRRRFAWLEEQANDIESASHLKAIRKKITSERLLRNHRLFELGDELSQIESQLADHFKREEKALRECCLKIAGADLESALTDFRIDHADILVQISDIKKEAEKIDVALSNGESRINESFDFRVRITEARVFLERHAEKETHLFEKLRNKLSAS